ncbi:MAG: hypothetical protein ACI8P0_003228 [Planctomycetaceae bacterium]
MKIVDRTNGLATDALLDSNRPGSSVANIGDLNGDGVAELAVGATGDDTGGSDRGAVHVLFLNKLGTVESSVKIADGIGGLAAETLKNGDGFGGAVTSVGDLDGDGINDLAVGADRDDEGDNSSGAVHVLFLNDDGTVQNFTKIASDTGGGPTLANGDRFGHSVTAIGDLNDDGITDLVVGAFRDSTGGLQRGALYVVLLSPL